MNNIMLIFVFLGVIEMLLVFILIFGCWYAKLITMQNKHIISQNELMIDQNNKMIQLKNLEMNIP